MEHDCLEGDEEDLQRLGTGCEDSGEAFGIYLCEYGTTWRCYGGRPEETAWEKE